ncbi:hypothetical protein GYA49_00150 [Candidatus Beckwithbacteria bacterium]|nr:hypothetical protein [Candidatus Beckwithbacteria bacterium]
MSHPDKPNFYIEPGTSPEYNLVALQSFAQAKEFADDVLSIHEQQDTQDVSVTLGSMFWNPHFGMSGCDQFTIGGQKLRFFYCLASSGEDISHLLAQLLRENPEETEVSKEGFLQRFITYTLTEYNQIINRAKTKDKKEERKQELLRFYLRMNELYQERK